MPRKGPISLSVLPAIEPQRPKPPVDFTPPEAAIWRDVVGVMRPDWIGPEAHPLVAAFVFHAVAAQEFATRMRALAYDHPEHRELLKAHRAECKMMLALARALRLTPKSNRLGDEARVVSRALPKPWEPSA